MSTYLLEDMTHVTFHYPLDMEWDQMPTSPLIPPSRDNISYKIWVEGKRKVKKATSTTTIRLPFSLDSYSVYSVDPGEQSLGIRAEKLENGQCAEVYVSEIWSIEHDRHSIAAMSQKIQDLVTDGIDILVIEEQINPKMIYIENIFVSEFLRRGIIVAVVASALKSFVFKGISDGNLTKNSIIASEAILTAEGDNYTLDQLKSQVGTRRVSKQKKKSDLTDPVLQLRGFHVHATNFCTGITSS